MSINGDPCSKNKNMLKVKFSFLNFKHFINVINFEMCLPYYINHGHP
jgi:hypothetical protein